MNRPWVIWTTLGTCALLILGAMGWLTQRVVGLEEERAVSLAQAELEERIRLALARMDTAASGVLLVENQRPPAHYEPFYRPADIFTNQFQNVAPGIVLQPSPLLGEPPEFVRLQFAFGPGYPLTSPQVPTGNQRDLAEASGIGAAVLDAAAADLRSLEAMLASPAGAAGAAAAAPPTNLDRFYLACAPATVAWNTVSPEEVLEKVTQVQQQRANDGGARESSRYQTDFNWAEKGKRAQVLEAALSKAAESSAKQAVAPVPPQPQGVQQDAAQQDAAQQAAAPSQTGAAVIDPSRARMEDPVSLLDLTASVTPFQPLWAGGELFAVRKVQGNGGARYQALWLRASELAYHLVGVVDDLLPAASLQPVEAIAAPGLAGIATSGAAPPPPDDPRALVTMPWRLVPGETAAPAPLGWTPLRLSLAVGWVAVALSLLAAAALVRGVMRLSDRRAAFVSSVTHELRTPLTTFQLYADMLAERMVPNESKRQEYAEVLRNEAGRLNHLIENVLAYSRVERGSAKARREVLRLGQLIDRLAPRLVERAAKCGARLEVARPDPAGDAALETDVTAVGQIVFNLVDNACKYGMPDSGEGVVRLLATSRGNSVRIAVCDQGKGIARRDRRHVFRPFHKSAADAAHSKPGVGLGLALSKRLATELGGDLRIEPADGAGACFVLELPAG
jgi:signal transduction histidine kinase